MADPTPQDPSASPSASASTPASGAGDSKAAAALAAVQAAIAAAKSGLSAPAAAAPAPASAPDPAPTPSPATAPVSAPIAGKPFQPPSFDRPTGAALPKGMDLLSDVNLSVKIELGRTRMLVDDVLKLGEGAVVELDKLAGDPVDVYVNDRHIARGEVLVLNDNFCVRVNEIVSTDDVGHKGKARG